MNEITALVDRYLAQMAENNVHMMTPAAVPPEMLDPSIAPDSDWKGWKPAPSVVNDHDLDQLEHDIGYALPPSYRTFLKHKHFYSLLMDDDAVWFPAHVPDKNLTFLREYVFEYMDPELIIGRGYIYFADLTDHGALCFDTSRRDENGECPVIFLDHESLEEVYLYASNFTDLLTGDAETATRFYERLNEEQDR